MTDDIQERIGVCDPERYELPAQPCLTTEVKVDLRFLELLYLHKTSYVRTLSTIKRRILLFFFFKRERVPAKNKLLKSTRVW
jgi:hypothetical protein